MCNAGDMLRVLIHLAATLPPSLENKNNGRSKNTGKA